MEKLYGPEDPVLEMVKKIINQSNMATLLYLKREYDHGRERKRFKDIMFGTERNPGIISRSLRFLVDNGLVAKIDGDYALTETGLAVAEKLQGLYDIVRKEWYSKREEDIVLPWGWKRG